LTRDAPLLLQRPWRQGLPGRSLVIGLGMVWFAMPNKQGENPRFLRFGLAQMIYPVTALLFLVIGVAQLIVALA
jgi:hypothetical protein